QAVGREGGLNASPFALFLLLRTDRFPVRPRGLLRKLPHPFEEQRRRRVIVRDKREFLGRAGEIARTITGQARPIGLRAGQELRRDLARRAEPLENPPPPAGGPGGGGLRPPARRPPPRSASPPPPKR